MQAAVTDAAGNTASAGDSFTLDTSADVDTNFAVSVAADDQVTNLAESTDVSLSLSGIDSDAASVSVEISDAGDNSVTANATNDSTGNWMVSDQNLSSLADGALTVSATVTDAAGNSAPAVSASLTLDTVADLGSDLSGIFVDGDDSVMNADEAADGAILVSGFSAPDLQSVAATVTDGAGGITVTASLGDIANSIPPSVAATIVDYDGDVTVRFSSALTSDAISATLVAEPMDPSVGGLTHVVDFTDPLNLAEAPIWRRYSPVASSTRRHTGQMALRWCPAWQTSPTSLSLSRSPT